MSGKEENKYPMISAARPPLPPQRQRRRKKTNRPAVKLDIRENGIVLRLSGVPENMTEEMITGMAQSFGTVFRVIINRENRCCVVHLERTPYRYTRTNSLIVELQRMEAKAHDLSPEAKTLDEQSEEWLRNRFKAIEKHICEAFEGLGQLLPSEQNRNTRKPRYKVSVTSMDRKTKIVL